LAKETRDVQISRVIRQWPAITILGSGGHLFIAGGRKGPPLCAPNGPASCFEQQGYYVRKPGDPNGVRTACYAAIYIDGVLMNPGSPTPYWDVGAMYADQAEAVEWYAGPSETPGRYSNLNAVCGVLVIYTRRTP
jgi:hypothetical protein